MVADVIPMADPELLEMAARIKAAMASRGWSLEKLAVESGVPFSSLATYVSANPAELKARRLVRVAHALGMSADELVTGEPFKPESAGRARKKAANG